MKKLITLLLPAIFLLPYVSAYAQEKENYFGVFANVGGAALMGPSIGVEYTLNNRFIFEASYRIPAWGAIMTTITDFNNAVEGYTKAGGYGINAGVKRFFPRGNGGWYCGLFIDYGYLEYTYRVPYINPWGNRDGTEGRYMTSHPLGFGGNVGYKFQLTERIYLRAGAYLGAMITGEQNYYDNSDDSLVYREDSALYPYANLDISIGFRF